MFRFSERQIVEMLQEPASRVEGFSIIVNQYKERIYWYVRRMVIDYHDAKDVTQNVFVKAWEGLEYFQYQSSIYTWLYRIATNESLNHLKKKCNRLHIPIEEAGEYLVNAIDKGLYISGEEIHLKLEKAVAQLPDKQRVIFILRYFEDKSYDEIAEITGTSEGALHASYHLAVKKIEKILEAG